MELFLNFSSQDFWGQKVQKERKQRKEKREHLRDTFMERQERNEGKILNIVRYKR